LLEIRLNVTSDFRKSQKHFCQLWWKLVADKYGIHLTHRKCEFSDQL